MSRAVIDSHGTAAPALDTGGRFELRAALTSEPAVLVMMLLALGIFYYGPGLTSVAVGVLGFFALCVFRPAMSLTMVPLTAPLFYRPRTLTGDKYVAIAEMIVLVAAAAWAARDGWSFLRTRRLPNIRAIIMQPAVLFALALGVIGTVWLLVPPSGDDRKVALREYRWTIVEPLIFFLMMLRWLRTERDVWRMVGAWLIGAALIGREGAEQYFFGQTWSMEGVGRVSAVYPSATAYGIYLGRPLACALTLAVFLPRTAWRWRLACVALALPIGLGVVFSFARGAWIGVFAALVVVALLARGKALLGALGGLTLFGLASLPFIRVERITSMFDFGTQDNTGVSRLRIWEAALRVIRDHPVFGIGQDQFLRVDPKYGVPQVRFITVSHPHDWILDWWLRLGLPGLAWLVAALAYFFYRGYVLWKSRLGTASGALVLAFLAAMTDFAVHGLIDMAYFTMDLALTFWLMFGLLTMLEKLPQSEPSSDIP